jgi:hypothetical protein
LRIVLILFLHETEGRIVTVEWNCEAILSEIWTDKENIKVIIHY